MKHSATLAVGAICFALLTLIAISSANAGDDEQALLRVDRAAFEQGNLSSAAHRDLLDRNFTWTDSSGITRTKSQVVQDSQSKKKARTQTGPGKGAGTSASSSVTARVYGQVGIVQENSGKVYVLRVWVKHPAGWQALVYQAVAIGAPSSFEPGNGACKNPCETVPFVPRTADEREVIHAYQAVERAVTAHNSSEWGVHIADEFFAVTSNSDRPLDKATRMAGLDNRKVSGIAPLPLVSARMFEFGDAMVMISRQQPERGLPLHATRVWFKRNGTWLEGYSYQTTIQPAAATTR